MKHIEKTLIRRIHDRADSSCINLGLGELKFPTPKPILDHVREKAAEWNLGYTPNEGLAELRHLIAENSGYKVHPDQVCVTVGAEEALFATLMVLVDSGDEVLIPDPGFPAYASIVRIAGGQPKTYPLYREYNFSLRAEDVERSLTAKTKAVIVNSPNNPSGAVYAGEELRRLARICEERRVLVISDEVYRNIFFEEEPDSVARYTRNFVVINSLSKSFSMTGWRLGWCIVPLELIKGIAGFHQLSVTCAPTISQHAAVFALKGFAEKERLENREKLRRRRELAMTALAANTDLSFARPAGTFYIYVDISKKMAKYGKSMEISLSLISKAKVVTIPGSAFGERGEGYFRISYAADPEQIEEGIRRIGRHLS
ncbi:MAG: aminotransferase class I/II-fold pyridoxal phosphate-dependent enzyme [Candidatus Aminicenantales bacterium]